MIIDYDFKPWLLTELKRTPALSGALYDKKEHALKVTNGKALVILPVRDDEEDEDGIIPADALKEAAKLGRRSPLGVRISVKGGAALLPDGRSWPLIMTPGAFPCVDQVIPNKIGWTRTARIMLDAELLYQLADAAGAFGKYPTRSVIMEFETDEEGDARPGPVLVTAGKARTAVLMPMRWKSAKEKTSADAKEDGAGDHAGRNTPA